MNISFSVMWSWLTSLPMLVCMCCTRHACVCPPVLMQSMTVLFVCGDFLFLLYLHWHCGDQTISQNLLCCNAFRPHEHTLVWIFLQNVINHFIQTVKDQPFLKTKPIWWGKRWSVHTLYQIQNQTSQGGPNRYIKACVKSNITKAVSDAARFVWIVKSGSWIFVMVNIYCFWMRVWITESRPKWQNNTHILWSDEEQKQLLIYPKTANISYYHCY